MFSSPKFKSARVPWIFRATRFVYARDYLNTTVECYPFDTKSNSDDGPMSLRPVVFKLFNIHEPRQWRRWGLEVCNDIVLGINPFSAHRVGKYSMPIIIKSYHTLTSKHDDCKRRNHFCFNLRFTYEMIFGQQWDESILSFLVFFLMIPVDVLCYFICLVQYNNPRTFIDSGTTFLALPSKVYFKLVSALQHTVNVRQSASVVCCISWVMSIVLPRYSLCC